MAKSEFGFAIDQNEWKEFIKMANDLPAKVGQQAFSVAVNDGVDKILTSMRSIISNSAENETGLLSKSLNRRRKRKYEPMFWHGSVAISVGKKRGDGAYYWHMVEYGHRIVTASRRDTGGRTRAMRFAISAFEQNKISVTAAFASKAKSVLQKYFK